MFGFTLKESVLQQHLTFVPLICVPPPSPPPLTHTGAAHTLRTPAKDISPQLVGCLSGYRLITQQFRRLLIFK